MPDSLGNRVHTHFTQLSLHGSWSIWFCKEHSVVFWDVAPCRSYVNRRFGGTYRLHLQGTEEPAADDSRRYEPRRPRYSVPSHSFLDAGTLALFLVSFSYNSAATCSRWLLACGFFFPEDGGDTFLRNVGSHKIYTAPHPRRRHSS
jgi:hypothetical protein